jgi:hypothetical protein
MIEDVSSFDLTLRKIHMHRAKRALPGPAYYRALQWIHEALRPAVYVEIGVHEGDSLSVVLPDTLTIGVDPAPHITCTPKGPTRVFTMTSNDFFEQQALPEVMGARHFSLAFIDGLHAFEQALLDFINLERYAGPDSFILLHDCIPLNHVTSARVRTTHFYSGDVWKLTLCLREVRRDLKMAIIPAPPTGLCIVGGLDPTSDRLHTTYDACLAKYGELSFDDYRMLVSAMPTSLQNTRESVQGYLASCLARGNQEPADMGAPHEMRVD